MDNLDHKLISLLRNDARLPVNTLAIDLGISRATVRNRIDRLIENNDILGFTVILKDHLEGRAIRAIMMVKAEAKMTEKVINRLYGFPEIREIHTTNGQWDILAEVSTLSLQELDDVLRRVGLLEGIATTETSLLLSARKHVFKD